MLQQESLFTVVEAAHPAYRPRTINRPRAGQAGADALSGSPQREPIHFYLVRQGEKKDGGKLTGGE